MELTLYQNRFCPWSERARRVLGEMGLVYQRVEVGWHELDGLQRLTGSAELPTLMHEHQVTTGSGRIARYVDGFNADRQLFPKTLAREIMAWESEADRMLDVFMRLALPVWAEHLDTFKEREAFRKHFARFGEYTELRPRAFSEWNRTKAEWIRLDDVLEDQPYLTGHALTYADLAMYGSVHAIAQFKGYYVPDAVHDLASWYERIRTAGQYRDQEIVLGHARARREHKDGLYAEQRYQDPATDTREGDDRY